MKALDCIMTRRSVRAFTSKPVDRDSVVEVIKAAQYAPSAHNKQPWEFFVIEDKNFLQELHTIQKWTLFAKDAPMAILVCGDEDRAFHNDEEGYSYVDIDCALATQNLLLAIHAKGLSACYCAAAPIPTFINSLKSKLDLPANIRPIAIVVLGHPEGEIKQPENRFKSEKIHWGKW